MSKYLNALCFLLVILLLVPFSMHYGLIPIGVGMIAGALISILGTIAGEKY